MFNYIINTHKHAIQITDIEFPLNNIYLVESKETITIEHPLRFSLYCPTCKIGQYPGTSNSIHLEWEKSKYYFIEEFTVQENCWLCPCFYYEPFYLEIVSATNIQPRTPHTFSQKLEIL